MTITAGLAGQYTDPESGLIYLRNRYYDPATAEFLTRDPAVAITGSAYGYVADNPLNGDDPTGQLCQHIGGVGIGFCNVDAYARHKANLALKSLNNNLKEVAKEEGVDKAVEAFGPQAELLKSAIDDFDLAKQCLHGSEFQSCAQGLVDELASIAIPEEMVAFNVIQAFLQFVNDTFNIVSQTLQNGAPPPGLQSYQSGSPCRGASSSSGPV